MRAEEFPRVVRLVGYEGWRRMKELRDNLRLVRLRNIRRHRNDAITYSAFRQLHPIRQSLMKKRRLSDTCRIGKHTSSSLVLRQSSVLDQPCIDAGELLERVFLFMNPEMTR